MDLEVVVWGYLPIAIGLLVISGSFILTAKKRNISGFIASFLIFVLNSLAIWILARIIDGAYPTYMPHFFILVSVVFLVIQYLLKKKNKTFANNI